MDYRLKKKQNNFGKFHSQLDLPFLETDNEFFKEIFQTLELHYGLKRNSNQIFIDLGAGNGKIVIYSALFYRIKSHGIEIDSCLLEEAKSQIKSFKMLGTINKKIFRKIKFFLGDFYLLNLKKYDFIYIYSLPTMQKYLNHVFITAKRGAIILSHKYKLEFFNSFLKLEYKLVHNKKKQKIYTYFYKKIS